MNFTYTPRHDEKWEGGTQPIEDFCEEDLRWRSYCKRPESLDRSLSVDVLSRSDHIGRSDHLGRSLRSSHRSSGSAERSGSVERTGSAERSECSGSVERGGVDGGATGSGDRRGSEKKARASIESNGRLSVESNYMMPFQKSKSIATLPVHKTESISGMQVAKTEAEIKDASKIGGSPKSRRTGFGKSRLTEVRAGLRKMDIVEEDGCVKTNLVPLLDKELLDAREEQKFDIPNTNSVEQQNRNKQGSGRSSGRTTRLNPYLAEPRSAVEYFLDKVAPKLEREKAIADTLKKVQGEGKGSKERDNGSLSGGLASSSGNSSSANHDKARKTLEGGDALDLRRSKRATQNGLGASKNSNLSNLNGTVEVLLLSKEDDYDELCGDLDLRTIGNQEGDIFKGDKTPCVDDEDDHDSHNGEHPSGRQSEDLPTLLVSTGGDSSRKGVDGKVRSSNEETSESEFDLKSTSESAAENEVLWKKTWTNTISNRGETGELKPKKSRLKRARSSIDRSNKKNENTSDPVEDLVKKEKRSSVQIEEQVEDPRLMSKVIVDVSRNSEKSFEGSHSRTSSPAAGNPEQRVQRGTLKTDGNVNCPAGGNANSSTDQKKANSSREKTETKRLSITVTDTTKGDAKVVATTKTPEFAATEDTITNSLIARTRETSMGATTTLSSMAATTHPASTARATTAPTTMTTIGSSAPNTMTTMTTTVTERGSFPCPPGWKARYGSGPLPTKPSLPSREELSERKKGSLTTLQDLIEQKHAGRSKGVIAGRKWRRDLHLLLADSDDEVQASETQGSAMRGLEMISRETKRPDSVANPIISNFNSVDTSPKIMMGSPAMAKVSYKQNPSAGAVVVCSNSLGKLMSRPGTSPAVFGGNTTRSTTSNGSLWIARDESYGGISPKPGTAGSRPRGSRRTHPDYVPPQSASPHFRFDVPQMTSSKLDQEVPYGEVRAFGRDQEVMRIKREGPGYNNLHQFHKTTVAAGHISNVEKRKQSPKRPSMGEARGVRASKSPSSPNTIKRVIRSPAFQALLKKGEIPPDYDLSEYVPGFHDGYDEKTHEIMLELKRGGQLTGQPAVADVAAVGDTLYKMYRLAKKKEAKLRESQRKDRKVATNIADLKVKGASNKTLGQSQWKTNSSANVSGFMAFVVENKIKDMDEASFMNFIHQNRDRFRHNLAATRLLMKEKEAENLVYDETVLFSNSCWSLKLDKYAKNCMEMEEAEHLQEIEKNFAKLEFETPGGFEKSQKRKKLASMASVSKRSFSPGVGRNVLGVVRDGGLSNTNTTVNSTIRGFVGSNAFRRARSAKQKVEVQSLQSIVKESGKTSFKDHLPRDMVRELLGHHQSRASLWRGILPPFAGITGNVGGRQTGGTSVGSIGSKDKLMKQDSTVFAQSVFTGMLDKIRNTSKDLKGSAAYDAGLNGSKEIAENRPNTSMGRQASMTRPNTSMNPQASMNPTHQGMNQTRPMTAIERGRRASIWKSTKPNDDDFFDDSASASSSKGKAVLPGKSVKSLLNVGDIGSQFGSMTSQNKRDFGGTVSNLDHAISGGRDKSGSKGGDSDTLESVSGLKSLAQLRRESLKQAFVDINRRKLERKIKEEVIEESKKRDEERKMKLAGAQLGSKESFVKTRRSSVNSLEKRAMIKSKHVSIFEMQRHSSSNENP